MMQGGRYAEAVEQFKDAISIDRDNRDYRLALAEALLAAKTTWKQRVRWVSCFSEILRTRRRCKPGDGAGTGRGDEDR